MAQTKKRRKRKHRGTQAGSIERPSRPRRPQAKGDRRELARQRREERLARPPSWRAAAGRAAFAAALFLAIAYFLLDRRPVAVILATVIAFPVYVVAAYYTDLWRHRRYTRGANGGGAATSAAGRTRSRWSRRG